MRGVLVCLGFALMALTLVLIWATAASEMPSRFLWLAFQGAMLAGQALCIKKLLQ